MDSSSKSLKTIQLNDQKAGMQNVDKEAINKIIYETSKGTPYFISQEKKQQRIDLKVKEMYGDLEKISAAQRKDSLEKMDALCIVLESERDISHSLVHIDMDAFYAAVEMRDNPILKSKPMAVGSSAMLSTSNYEARKYGVRAAMPGFIAKKLCPELIIVEQNFNKYKAVSKEVMKIVSEYDPNYSAASLDEVYFNLTSYISKQHKKDKHLKQCLRSMPSSRSGLSDQSDEEEENAVNTQYENCRHCDWSISNKVRDQLAWEFVDEIRKKIFDTTKLTASAGIAPNTMLAKVCSDQNKPNGQFQIHSNVTEVKNFINSLPVKKISGIGPVQAQLLNGIGIVTCQDMYNKRDLVDLLFLQSSVQFYLRVALGLGSTEVRSDYVRKSIGVEETFKDTHNPIELHQRCEGLCHEMIQDLKAHHLAGKVVVLKIKTVNFEVHTRNATLPQYTADEDIVCKAAKRLLDNEIKAVFPLPLKLRLMGIRMSNLIDESDLPEDKQTKLKDFLQQPALSKSQKEIVDVPKSAFTCPICNKDMMVSLNLFNEHVDNCLKKSPDETKPSDTRKLFFKEHVDNCPEKSSGNTKTSDARKLFFKEHVDNGPEKSPDKTKPSDTRKLFFKEYVDNCPEKSSGNTKPSDTGKLFFKEHVDNCPEKSPDKTKPSDTKKLFFKEPHCSKLNSVTTKKDSNEESSTGSMLCPVCSIVQPTTHLDALNRHIDICLSKAAIKDLLAKDGPVTVKRKAVYGSSKNKKRKGEKTVAKTIDSYFQS